MRMDSDSEFDLHVPYDPIQSMRRFGWRYGYAATSCDYHPVTTGLFDVVAAHYRSTLGKELLLPAAFSETTPCHNINEHRWRWRASQALRWIKRAGQRQFAHASYK